MDKLLQVSSTKPSLRPLDTTNTPAWKYNGTIGPRLEVTIISNFNGTIENRGVIKSSPWHDGYILYLVIAGAVLPMLVMSVAILNWRRKNRKRLKQKTHGWKNDSIQSPPPQSYNSESQGIYSIYKEDSCHSVKEDDYDTVSLTESAKSDHHIYGNTNEKRQNELVLRNTQRSDSLYKKNYLSFTVDSEVDPYEDPYKTYRQQRKADDNEGYVTVDNYEIPDTRRRNDGDYEITLETDQSEHDCGRYQKLTNHIPQDNYAQLNIFKNNVNKLKSLFEEGNI